MVTSEAAERFLTIPLLSGVDLEARRALIGVLDESRGPTGALLMEEGQPNDRLHFLIEGSVAVVRAQPVGREEVVASLTAPSVFGETSFFRQGPPIVSVRVTEPAWFLTLDRDAHEQLRRNDLRTAEQLALAAAGLLAERFDLLDRRISDDLQRPADGPRRANEWASFRARLFEGAGP